MAFLFFSETELLSVLDGDRIVFSETDRTDWVIKKGEKRKLEEYIGELRKRTNMAIHPSYDVVEMDGTIGYSFPFDMSSICKKSTHV